MNTNYTTYNDRVCYNINTYIQLSIHVELQIRAKKGEGEKTTRLYTIYTVEVK